MTSTGGGASTGFDFALDTTLDEELARQEEQALVKKTKVATGDDPLSFLLGATAEEPKKPRRIVEFESIFDISKMIEEKTKTSSSPSQGRASSTSTTSNGPSSSSSSSSSSRSSLFLTGGGEEDFLRIIEQATKGGAAANGGKKHGGSGGSASQSQDFDEEEDDLPYDVAPKPTPIEMRQEFESFVYKSMPNTGEQQTSNSASTGEVVVTPSSPGDGSDESHIKSEDASPQTSDATLDTKTQAGDNVQSGQEEEQAQTDRELDLPILVQKALDRELVHTKIRGLIWKIFLGLLNDKPAEWKDQLQQFRTAYDVLHKRYMIDPHAEGRELDPAINNPLSQAEESPWQQYFQDADLKKQIMLDIKRVYPENGFFRDKDLQDMMLRILFIYAREHQHTLYKQGMHELLAPILYVLHRESVDAEGEKQITDDAASATKTAGETIALVNSSRFIEHDAYALFDKLMDQTHTWFLSGTRGPATNGLEAEPFSDPSAIDNSITSPVVQKCKRIQQELLRRADPQLYQYLTDLQIEPQLYALRWVRLLLGREFHLEDVLRLWDAIFAYGQGLVLVDYLIVAMLMFIRESIIGKEYTACLQRLFKYPPVEDVSGFITKALALINPKAAKASKSSSSPSLPSTTVVDSPLRKSSEIEVPTSSSVSQTSETPVQAPSEPKSRSKSSKRKEEKEKEKGSHRGGSLTASLKHLIPDSNPLKHHKKSPESPAVTALHQQVADLTARVVELDRTQNHMANRLERIIYTIQNGFIEKKSELSEEERMDSVLLALAELKQVKDILSGLLPLDPPDDFEPVLPAATIIPTASTAPAATAAAVTTNINEEAPTAAPTAVDDVADDPLQAND